MRDTTNIKDSTEQNARRKAIPSIAELDMRDYFAAKVMQGLVTARETQPKQIAEAAYIVADAMLEARK